MLVQDWTVWAFVIGLSAVLAVLGIYMIRATARLPELVRAFVTVIVGGLVVIFGGFRTIVIFFVPKPDEAGIFEDGFEMVPIVLQSSLFTGILLVAYLAGVLWAERKLTRQTRGASGLAGAKS